MDRDATWAEEEFGDADLGDVRRTERLVQLASVLGAQPNASLPEATDDPATLKAAYRFFANDHVQPRPCSPATSNPPTDACRPFRWYWRCRIPPTSTGPTIRHQDLGPLAAPSHQGLLAHTTLALTPERVPLGLLPQQVWARDPEVRHHQDHKQRPTCDKESQKWLTSLDAVIVARAVCPETHFISVGDREADVYDLFLVERPSGSICSCAPRRIARPIMPKSTCGRPWPRHPWRPR